jgi:hypothetical protein
MGAMVSSKHRDSVTFPIFWRGAWGPFVPGEDPRRRKDRHVWAVIATALPGGAVTFLKRLQPPDEARHEQTAHALRLLNQLSNTDRHAKLPLIAQGVEGLLARWKLPDGTTVDGISLPDDGNFVEDDAEIREVPDGAVCVESYGTPVVVIRSGMKHTDGRPLNLPIIDFITDTASFLRKTVIPGLLRYVRTPGQRAALSPETIEKRSKSRRRLSTSGQGALRAPHGNSLSANGSDFGIDVETSTARPP